MKKNVPYRTNEQIWLEVDRFRLVVGVEPNLGPPVETVAIAELALRLNAVRFPGLFARFKQDAAITPDLIDLDIDAEAYDAFEAKNDWVSNRLRFSVAHELGHFFLHAEEIRANRFASRQEFKAWMGDRTHSITPEYQADEFAGRLLVPREVLIEWYDRHVEVAKGNDAEWWQHTGARTKLARKIAPRFGVNYQVIETRLDREGLWPADGMLHNAD